MCAAPAGSGGGVIAFAQRTFQGKTYVGYGDGSWFTLGSHVLSDLPANTLLLVDIDLRIMIYGTTGGTQTGYMRVYFNETLVEEKFIYTSPLASQWIPLYPSFSLSEHLASGGDFEVRIDVQNTTWTNQQISFETPKVRIVAMPMQ